MIEEFIQNNKDSFEEELPKGHFQRFENRRGTSSESSWSIKLNRYLVVAASVVVILTIGFVALLTRGNLSSSEYLLSNITPELYETEAYYQTEINQKMETLSEREKIDKSIFIDLMEMDESFETIKKDIEENPGDERLISAILNTYQMKMDLLDEILNRIE